MNKIKAQIYQIKIGLAFGLLIVLGGCASYGNGAFEGEAVVVSEPDGYLFGGGYDRGRDVHNYSHRGSVSRGASHSGGNHAAARVSGRNGGRR